MPRLTKQIRALIPLYNTEYLVDFNRSSTPEYLAFLKPLVDLIYKKWFKKAFIEASETFINNFQVIYHESFKLQGGEILFLVQVWIKNLDVYD